MWVCASWNCRTIGIFILRLSALFYEFTEPLVAFSLKYWLIGFCTHQLFVYRSYFIFTRSKHLNRYFVFIPRIMGTFGGFFIVAPLICANLLCYTYFFSIYAFFHFYWLLHTIFNINCYSKFTCSSPLSYVIRWAPIGIQGWR